jgi:predicted small secreted protein
VTGLQSAQQLEIAMCPRTTLLAFTLLALIGAAPLLAACHTTAGAGEDISSAGRAIERSADKHAP